MTTRILITVAILFWSHSQLLAQTDVERAKKEAEKLALQNAGQKATKITLSEAVARALKAVPGQAIGVKLDVEQKKTRLKVEYQVSVLLLGKKYVIDVSAIDGSITDVEPKYEAPTPPAGSGSEMHFHFDGDVPGAPAADWTPGENASTGTPGSWKIVAMDNAPSGKNVIALTDTVNKGSTYNLLIGNHSVGPNLFFETKVKALGGEIDQGGGVMWRVQDANNYYITRWNPLEKNLRVYKVIDGKRSAPLKSVDVEADAGGWHTLRVDHIGTTIQISLDGAKLIDCEDDTIKGAGKIGLWTKADAKTAFDALVLSSLGG